ncbi:MAG: ribonuclease P protein component [Desulfobacterales bacterium CG2_30_60_27]|nr:MAG: ribonuclease P protein component [Desulfobacterales bacterium CG2_30_60_27]
MKQFSLPKARLLTKTWEYDRVYRQGKRLRGQHFSLIIAANELGGNRLGVSVHGMKKAVQRNRIKRIVREFYRLHRALLPEAMDIVFTVRPGFRPATPTAVAEAVRKLLAKEGLVPACNRRSDPLPLFPPTGV